MKQRTIAIWGGDTRQAYAARAFLRAGWAVRQFEVPAVPGIASGEVCGSLGEAIKHAEIVLGPVPLKNFDTDQLLKHLSAKQVFFAGMIPHALRHALRRANISFFDLLERDDFATLNAISTAEGAIAEAIAASADTLHLCPTLVLGYGRCAKPLIKKLQGLGCQITVVARRWESACAAIADGCEVLDFSVLSFHLPRFGYIFNTVPAVVLDEPLLQNISPEATVIDIASAPGGLDYSAADRLGLNAKLCGSLPGKYAPCSTGESIAQVTRIILEEREGAAWGWNKPASVSD